MRTRDILSSHSSSIYLSFFCLLFADHFPLTPFNFHLTAHIFFHSLSTEINWIFSARSSCGLSFEQKIYHSLAYAAKQWVEQRTIAAEYTQATSDAKTVWRICVNLTHFDGILLAHYRIHANYVARSKQSSKREPSPDYTWNTNAYYNIIVATISTQVYICYRHRRFCYFSNIWIRTTMLFRSKHTIWMVRNGSRNFFRLLLRWVDMLLQSKSKYIHILKNKTKNDARHSMPCYPIRWYGKVGHSKRHSYSFFFLRLCLLLLLSWCHECMIMCSPFDCRYLFNVLAMRCWILFWLVIHPIPWLLARTPCQWWQMGVQTRVKSIELI